MNKAERNLLKYLQGVNETPSDTELVAAVAALPQDDADRESAISSLRDLVDDYDQVRAGGDLSGADVGTWEYGL